MNLILVKTKALEFYDSPAILNTIFQIQSVYAVKGLEMKEPALTTIRIVITNLEDNELSLR